MEAAAAAPSVRSQEFSISFPSSNHLPANAAKRCIQASKMDRAMYRSCSCNQAVVASNINSFKVAANAVELCETKWLRASAAWTVLQLVAFAAAASHSKPVNQCNNKLIGGRRDLCHTLQNQRLLSERQGWTFRCGDLPIEAIRHRG